MKVTFEQGRNGIKGSDKQIHWSHHSRQKNGEHKIHFAQTCLVKYRDLAKRLVVNVMREQLNGMILWIIVRTLDFPMSGMGNHCKIKSRKMIRFKKNINPAALLKTWCWATGEGVETTVIRSQQRRVDGWTNSEIVTEMVRRAQI